MLHALDAASPDDVSTGMRVQARWGDEPVGHIRDIDVLRARGRCARRPVGTTSRGRDDGDTPVALRVQYSASIAETMYLLGLQQGRLLGQRCPKCRKVYVPAPRRVPGRRRAHRGRGRSAATRAPSPRSASSTCRSSASRIEPPYVAATILLDGADIAVLPPDPRLPGRRRAHGHARRGGLGAATRSGTHAREHQVVRAHRRAGRALRARTRSTSDADVAVIDFAAASATCARDARTTNDVEMLVPVVARGDRRRGLDEGRHRLHRARARCDYLAGSARSRSSRRLDAVGAWPPIAESHVEMDGAWALYEAWVRSSTATSTPRWSTASASRRPGDLRGCSPCSSTRTTWRRCGRTAVASPRCRRARCSTRALHRARPGRGRRAQPRATREDNPYAQVTGDVDVDELLTSRTSLDPLRAHDFPPITDGAAAVVLAAGDRARELVRATRPGSAASSTASSRTRSACATSPARRRPRSPASAAGRRTASTSPSCTRRSATRS